MATEAPSPNKCNCTLLALLFASVATSSINLAVSSAATSKTEGNGFLEVIDLGLFLWFFK